MCTKNTGIDSLHARKRLLIAESDLNREQLIREWEQSRLAASIVSPLVSFFSGLVSQKAGEGTSRSVFGWLLKAAVSLVGLGKMLRKR